jgi:hypothetical protein
MSAFRTDAARSVGNQSLHGQQDGLTQDVANFKVWLSTQIKLNFLSQRCKRQRVTFANAIFEHQVGHVDLVRPLNPFHTARRQIWCRSTSTQLLEDIVLCWGTFEGNSQLAGLVPSSNRKHLASNFPNVSTAPLYDVRRVRQRPTEAVVGFELHCAPASLA